MEEMMESDNRVSQYLSVRKGAEERRKQNQAVITESLRKVTQRTAYRKPASMSMEIGGFTAGARGAGLLRSTYGRQSSPLREKTGSVDAQPVGANEERPAETSLLVGEGPTTLQPAQNHANTLAPSAFGGSRKQTSPLRNTDALAPASHGYHINEGVTRSRPEKMSPLRTFDITASRSN